MKNEKSWFSWWTTALLAGLLSLQGQTLRLDEKQAARLSDEALLDTVQHATFH
jgi:hypothetical protein